MRAATETGLPGDRLQPMQPPLVPEITINAGTSMSGLSALSHGVPPYWAFPWPGGCLLARYLLDNRRQAAGRRALDLGTGCGIAAIAAALAGAAVTAIDTDPLAIEAARMNAALNGVELVCETGDPLGAQAPETDLLLVGDLFYLEGLARRTTRFLDRCHDLGAAILVGDIGRRYLPVERLSAVASYQLADFGSSRMETGTVYRWKKEG